MLARLNFKSSIRQFIMVAVVSMLSLIVPFLMSRYDTWKSFTWIYCFVGIGLLTAVYLAKFCPAGLYKIIKPGIDLLAGIPSVVYGFLGGFQFQPSEFVKIIFVFFVAGMLAKSTSFKHIVLSAIMAGLHVIILVLSTDLGSALIYFMIYVFMVYVGTHKARYLVLGFTGFSVASLVAYKLFSHVQTRVVAWKDPWSTISGAGYQVAHSLFALGNGGFTGTGLYQGKPNYVPEVEQDFIFSAVGEEFGAVFGMLLILVCLTCFIVFLVTAMQQINIFNKLVCVGLGIQYAFQIILTVGGAIKMIPSTGVTLPLLSYGGSSIISTLIVFAIIQGLSIVGATQVPVRKKKAVEDRRNVKARNTAKISGLENTQEIKINSKR